MEISQTLNSARLVGLFYETKGQAAIKEYKLTKTEFHILSFLINNPKHNNAKAIEEYKKIPKASVSLALESLIDKKLITKKPDDKDRRVQHLYLTHRVDKIQQILLDVNKELATLLFEGFTEEEIKVFKQFESRIYKNIENNMKDIK